MVGPFQHREAVMGTVVTIDVYANPGTPDWERTGVRDRLAAAVAVLHQADQVFSTWQPDSPVSRLRRRELAIADAPAEVAEVMAACATARELSGCWFDPWAMPDGFDPTGYVKGWAAQRALAEFHGDWIAGAIVNAAGDIASRGRQPTGRPFRFGIVDPASPRQLAEIVQIMEPSGAVATSGSYARGSHLLDPQTGQPMARAASATVTGPDLGLADALATALAVAGPDGLAFIEPIEGFEALVIGFDGSKIRTRQFPTAASGVTVPSG